MFNVKSLNEVQDIIRQTCHDYPLQEMAIQTIQALGYVTSEDIYSTCDVPHFRRSTVDGYAVKYDDVKLASESSPSILTVIGSVEMGHASPSSLNPSQAIEIPTGGHVPDGSDCVVMIENTQRLKDEVLIFKSVSKSDNIVQIGSDIQKGTILVPKHTTITPQVIGALMSQNITTITCFRPLSSTVISTGDEIIETSEALQVGEVRDINTFTISNKLITHNIQITKTIIVRDNYEQYKESILTGFKQSDIVFSSGGSSVGEKDYTDKILTEMGAAILVHGLNIKPGKPTIIATYKNKLFVGLPGHPTSAFTVLKLLLPTIIHTIYHIKELPTPFFHATLLENVANNSGRTLIQLVEYVEKNGEPFVRPLYAKSAMINTLQRADGYIIIDPFKEGLYKDTVVQVYR